MGAKKTKIKMHHNPEEVADEMWNNHMRGKVIDFIKAVQSGSANGQGIITIDELERSWDILDLETQKSYADIVGAELSALNEKPLIDAKKGNSKERE